MMTSCQACEGFVPHSSSHCPHCDAAQAPQKAPGLGARLLQAAGGCAVAMTLMACYGAMHDYHDDYQPEAEQPYCQHGTDAYGECNDPPQPITCGNGALNAGEACDDGNQQSGDGCSADCAIELCGGATPLALGVSDDTTASNQSSQLFHTPCSETDSYGRERIYYYDSGEHGTLSIIPSAGVSLYASWHCSAVNSVDTSFPPTGEQACGGTGEPLDIPLRANDIVYIVVDTPQGSEPGPFTLDASFTPGCGDGQLQPYAGESCDPGAAGEGDAAHCSECFLSIDSYCDSAPVVMPGSYAGDTSDGLFANRGMGCDGNDEIVTFTAPSYGTFIAIAEGEFDISLKLLDTCTDATVGDGSCSNESAAGSQEVVAQVLNEGEQVWLMVDGAGADQQGVFDLTVDFVPAAQP